MLSVSLPLQIKHFTHDWYVLRVLYQPEQIYSRSNQVIEPLTSMWCLPWVSINISILLKLTFCVRYWTCASYSLPTSGMMKQKTTYCFINSGKYRQSKKSDILFWSCATLPTPGLVKQKMDLLIQQLLHKYRHSKKSFWPCAPLPIPGLVKQKMYVKVPKQNLWLKTLAALLTPGSVKQKKYFLLGQPWC